MNKILKIISKNLLNKDVRNSIIATLIATAILGCFTIFFKNRNISNFNKNEISSLDSIAEKNTLNKDTLKYISNKKILAAENSSTTKQNKIQKLIIEGNDFHNSLEKKRDVDEKKLQEWVNTSLGLFSEEDINEYNKMIKEFNGNPPKKNIIDKIMDKLYKNNQNK